MEVKFVLNGHVLQTGDELSVCEPGGKPKIGRVTMDPDSQPPMRMWLRFEGGGARRLLELVNGRNVFTLV